MMDEVNHGLGMGWGWIIGLVVLIVIIWIIVKAFNRKKTPKVPNDKSPMDILKERYARGEIGKDEYEEKRKSFS